MFADINAIPMLPLSLPPVSAAAILYFFTPRFADAITYGFATYAFDFAFAFAAADILCHYFAIFLFAA